MKQVDFSTGKISSNIFHTAAPMLVAQILNLLYSIVDRIYIGQIPGEGTIALGGIGLVFPMITLVTAFTNLYGSGGAPLCSMARGRRDLPTARKCMNIAFMLLVYTSVIIMIVGELFASPLLRLFGASDTNISYALSYLRIYLVGTPFAMISTGMNPYINAQGFSSTGMMTVIIGALTNIILDPIFIFVLHMNTRGAALATILSQLLSALFVIRFLTGPKAELRLKLLTFSQMRENLGMIGNIISLGAASFVMQFTNSLVSIACNSVLARFGGDLYISIMTIISSVRQIMDTPIMAVTDGTSPLISYNYGARCPDQIKGAVKLMTLISLIYTLVIWGLILITPASFIRIFTKDAELIQAAIPCLHIYFFAFIFQSLQYSGQTVFKSMNKKKKAIFFSLFRKVVMVIPLTYLLPYAFGSGVNGVFMAEPISNAIGGIACFTTMLLTVWPELNRMNTI